MLILFAIRCSSYSTVTISGRHGQQLDPDPGKMRQGTGPNIKGPGLGPDPVTEKEKKKKKIK